MESVWRSAGSECRRSSQHLYVINIKNRMQRRVWHANVVQQAKNTQLLLRQCVLTATKESTKSKVMQNQSAVNFALEGQNLLAKLQSAVTVMQESTKRSIKRRHQ